MPRSTTPLRSFSTAARIHPAFQPHMLAKMQSTMPQAPRRLGRWYLPATTILVMGYATASYLDRIYSPTRPVSGLTKGEQRALEQKERNAALMAAYDQRESLEDMQKAMEIYEAAAASSSSSRN